jgi:hypothetical protein
MKFMKLISILVVFLLASSLSYGQNYRDFNYEVQFLRTGLQGTELFKVFAYGRNERQCIENAKMDAVKAILFKGIPGSGLQKPMVTELSEMNEHKDYFKAFFKEDGPYLNYVSISNDGSINENDRYKVGNKLKIGVIVSVNKASLRNELESAGIIKRLNAGF